MVVFFTWLALVKITAAEQATSITPMDIIDIADEIDFTVGVQKGIRRL